MSIEITTRRRQVLDLLAEAYTDKAIARRLRISPLTAQNMVKRLAKIVLVADDDKSTRWALALWWMQHKAREGRR